MSRYYTLLLLLFIAAKTNSQVLTMKSALQTALTNYSSIKAKADYLKASETSVKQAALDYLPNLSVGAQQSYGTVNGQFGPGFAFGGLNTAAAGPPFQKQNWNAAFGSLYLANINWDFFTFGRIHERVNLAHAQMQREADDLEQEKFQHQVRVAGAYLNLLAAQRLRISQQRNLERATAFRDVVVARTKNGLNPGVDTSLANAEFSNAKIALTNAIDFEQEQSSRLAELMGISNNEFTLDTLLINKVPATMHDTAAASADTHPVLKFYRSRINVSNQQEKYYQRFKYPVFSLIGIIQSRGSGFHQNYNELAQDAITHDYWTGTKPTRSNYLVGVGVSWNLTDISRVHQQAMAQHYTSRGLQNEYEQINQQIKTQVQLAGQKIKNAIANYNEAPIQMKAATHAYHQRSVLFKNGLTDIVDVTQALYTLNRAETNRDIAITNVWQALLLKAAATGDFNLFINEF
jgi:outer membrane protein TolC